MEPTTLIPTKLNTLLKYLCSKNITVMLNKDAIKLYKKLIGLAKIITSNSDFNSEMYILSLNPKLKWNLL